MLYNRWLMLLEQPSQGEAFWLMQAFILLEEAKKEVKQPGPSGASSSHSTAGDRFETS